MDGIAPAAAPSGIVGWVSQYGNIVFFFAQLAYWVLLVAVLAWAAWNLHRWVKFIMGGSVVVERPVEETKDDSVAVEDFVD